MNALLDHKLGTKPLLESQLMGVLSQDPLYLDVRTPQEFEAVHIPGSWNVPLVDLHKFVETIKRISRERSILIVCRTGNRAKMGREYLSAHGISGCEILQGGMEGWHAQNKPVIIEKGGLSIEGRVRVIAGTLILLGVLLSLIVHGGFLILPAIVGVGLLHAGLTDSCLMGMLLARRPFHRSSSNESLHTHD